MGETGCGKTHLIRYMCKFAIYNKPMRKIEKEGVEKYVPVQNMFILKVQILLN